MLTIAQVSNLPALPKLFLSWSRLIYFHYIFYFRSTLYYFLFSPSHPDSSPLHCSDAVHPPGGPTPYLRTIALTCRPVVMHAVQIIWSCTSVFVILDKGGSPQECIYTPRYPVVLSRKVYSIQTLSHNNFLLCNIPHFPSVNEDQYLLLEIVWAVALTMNQSDALCFWSHAGKTSRFWVTPAYTVLIVFRKLVIVSMDGKLLLL